ncbi:RNA-binding protein [Candidatus Woesebacteria bacterium]|nr:RNA-binding protein [Candidatus Woesebacteria bacterium]|tara:strand:+ start:635 stop:925 length:291 start_codon:yes stop_codon:yes gene_type:complete
MTKLFIGSLPYSITDQELNDLFKDFGEVSSAQVVMDRNTGQSRGFGFVEMSNDEEAQKAIQKLNESDFKGRKIFVSVAKPREDRPDRGSFDRDDRG